MLLRLRLPSARTGLRSSPGLGWLGRGLGLSLSSLWSKPASSAWRTHPRTVIRNLPNCFFGTHCFARRWILARRLVILIVPSTRTVREQRGSDKQALNWVRRGPGGSSGSLLSLPCSHVLGHISPIFSPFFLLFCAFSPSRRGGSNEPQAETQGQETAGKGTKRGELPPSFDTPGANQRINWQRVALSISDALSPAQKAACARRHLPRAQDWATDRSRSRCRGPC